MNIEDLSNFSGRITVDDSTNIVQITNLILDTANAGIEVINAYWVHVVNCYSTVGPNPTGLATFTVRNGWLSIVNHNGWSDQQGMFDVSGGGRITYVGGRMQAPKVDMPLARLSSGVLRIVNSEIFATTSSAWTVPVISVSGSGSVFVFTGNSFFPPSVGDVGGVVIATDNAQHIVTDNYFNGWDFTPPGTLGNYQTGSNFYTKTITAGSFDAGSATTTTGLHLAFNSTAQRTINFYEANVTRWALGSLSQAADSVFTLLRYNSSGVQQPNPLTVSATNGTIFTNQNSFIASYTVDPAILPAAYGWRGIGLVGVDGVVPGFEVFQNATASPGYIRFARSRGTAASPTAVQQFDDLGEIIFGGYDGTAWQARTGLIRGLTTVNWANGSAYDTQLQFSGTIGTTLTQFLVLSDQGATLPKITATATAPGAGQARLAFIAGTGAGTAKLVAYAGTSTTPVTIADNIGAAF